MRAFKVTCGHCNGTGNIPFYNHVYGGVCFHCGGRGFLVRKTKPKPQIDWAVYISMSKDAQPTRWITAHQPSEKAAWAWATKIALRGCYSEFIPSLRIEFEKEWPVNFTEIIISP